MKYLLLFLLLSPFACLAQIKIMGKVVAAADGKPISNTSVFLSNAMVGSKTADDGTFTLYNVRPGQYEFVASVVGCSTYRIIVLAGKEDIILADIKLDTKTTELKEVKVSGNNDWERNFERFKADFIGTSTAAQDCKITNYDALTLDYDMAARKLSGSSNDFIEIENKYLGYKIKYLLTNFEDDGRANLLYFAGSSVFEELKGTPSEIKRWQKRRKLVYEGSAMHCLRALITGEQQKQGFAVYRFIRKPNPKEKETGAKYIQTLVPTPLQISEIVHPTDKDGILAVGLNDCLYIKFKSKPYTIITLRNNYAFFDHNGIIINPAEVIFEGEWGLHRMADMLPVDYQPVLEK